MIRLASSSSLYSPKQVSRALGVSESSLKRWCDSGLIRTVRTAGGHRKLTSADVLQFARERKLSPVSPEILGLPPASPLAERSLEQSTELLADALLAGDEATSAQIVFNLVLAEHPLNRIFDVVVAGAFHLIGDRWACQQADVYQERRGCEIMQRILTEVRKSQQSPQGKLIACGGTASGDNYTLPTAMVEVVLRDAGWQATSLGTSIPVTSLVRAIQVIRPHLFWLSVSHIADEAEFLERFAQLSAACTAAGTALVVGGRALSAELRQRMVYAACCDTLQQLTAFADSLARPHRGRGKKSAR